MKTTSLRDTERPSSAQRSRTTLDVSVRLNGAWLRSASMARKMLLYSGGVKRGVPVIWLTRMLSKARSEKSGSNASWARACGGWKR